MKYYQVILQGDDFFINYEGKDQDHGFFTTRWVKAGSPEEAELAAVDFVKKDEKLIQATKNVNGEEPKPMIYLEEISEVSWFSYVWRKPGNGYSFYIKEDEKEQS